jgi:hypothetical protein
VKYGHGKISQGLGESLGRARKNEELERSRFIMLALRDLMRPIGEHNVLQPACPICSRPLRLSRVTPRDGDLAELRTYGCTGCGVWLTEAADDKRDETLSDGRSKDDRSH